jgi:hypothetical protein
VSDTTITNTGVNSGAALKIQGAQLSWAIEVFSNAPDVPGQSTALSYNDRLPHGQNSGFGAPKITVNGYWDIDIAHATGASAVLDYEHLENLVANSHLLMLLTDDTFVTTANPTGSKWVELANVTVGKDTTNIRNYTLQFIEVHDE